jgi:hypothetical protein
VIDNQHGKHAENRDGQREHDGMQTPAFPIPVHCFLI